MRARRTKEEKEEEEIKQEETKNGEAETEFVTPIGTGVGASFAIDYPNLGGANLHIIHIRVCVCFYVYVYVHVYVYMCVYVHVHLSQKRYIFGIPS